MTDMRRLSSFGLIGATTFFVASLTPSLIPRSPLFQGVVSGICFTIGYAVAVLAARTALFLVAPKRVRPSRRLELGIWLTCIFTAVVFLGFWPGWQNAARAHVGMAPIGPFQILPMLDFTLFVAVLGLTLGKSISWLIGRTRRALNPYLPPRLAWLLGTVLIVTVAWLFVSGVAFRAAFDVADASYQELDEHIPPDTAPPLEAVTDSSTSLISWTAVGSAGRRYLSSAPTRSDIAAITGSDAVQPVRVYAGLNSAETADARADVALRELIMEGGFKRSILVVIAPTGTGWVDPRAIGALEYLQHGDVASVAVQYSYLPSWLSLLSEPENGTEAATALFRKVYLYWTKLPKRERPRLFLFGLSLGALASENAMDLLDVVADPMDGALWAGPPFQSRLWRFATAQREAGSPPWLPRFRDGSIIRFINQNHDPIDQGKPWGPIRIAYLQYGSDPITFFEPQAWYRQPQWMQSPRAPDVSPEMHWMPGVSFIQLVIDMAAATTTPAGYGHVYACSDYLKSWIALTGAKTWGNEKTDEVCGEMHATS